MGYHLGGLWPSLPPFDVGQVAVSVVAVIVAWLTFASPRSLDTVALIACGAVGGGGLSQVSVQVTAGKITYSEVQPCLGQVERTGVLVITVVPGLAWAGHTSSAALA